ADETRSVLVKLTSQKAHPALLAALTDAHTVRRAAAGEVLTRAALSESEVGKLLADKDAYVRMRVAMARAIAGQRSAVPVLIDALREVPLVQAWQADEFLYKLAEGRSPPTVSLGLDAASRAKCQEAWQAWWKQRGAKIDLAVLTERPRLLGYTMV